MGTLWWEVLISRNKTWRWSSWSHSKKAKNGLIFFNMSILITNLLNVGIYFESKICWYIYVAVPWAFLSRYAICWFHIFMEFLKFWNCSLLSFRIGNSCYQCVLQHVQLLVVELVTYCKKYCLVKKDKNYWSIYKFIFISPIGFDIVSTKLRLR